MAFDGIVLKQVIKELESCLLGGKINKIYQPNKNEILFVQGKEKYLWYSN